MCFEGQTVATTEAGPLNTPDMVNVTTSSDPTL